MKVYNKNGQSQIVGRKIKGKKKKRRNGVDYGVCYYLG